LHTYFVSPPGINRPPLPNRRMMTLSNLMKLWKEFGMELRQRGCCPPIPPRDRWSAPLDLFLVHKSDSLNEGAMSIAQKEVLARRRSVR
jgi:hypothetical protein